MVEWYKDLYVDAITRKCVKMLQSRIEKEKIQYPVFCISLASNPANLLDIMNVNELLFPYYKKKRIFILGLASSRQQAKIMAAAIIQKVYHETGGFDVRAYYDTTVQSGRNDCANCT